MIPLRTEAATAEAAAGTPPKKQDGHSNASGTIQERKTPGTAMTGIIRPRRRCCGCGRWQLCVLRRRRRRRRIGLSCFTCGGDYGWGASFNSSMIHE